MSVARVIPCLDVDAGRVVKGVNFVDLRDAGDPVELAARYDAEGADELVFLDITASSDARDTIVDVVPGAPPRRSSSRSPSAAASATVDDARRLLRAGADKVSVNTAAVDRPELVSARSPPSSAPSASSSPSTPAGAATATAARSFTHGGRTPDRPRRRRLGRARSCGSARARSC